MRQVFAPYARKATEILPPPRRAFEISPMILKKWAKLFQQPQREVNFYVQTVGITTIYKVNPL